MWISSHFFNLLENTPMETQDKAKKTEAKHAERFDKKHEQLTVSFSQRDTTQVLR